MTIYQKLGNIQQKLKAPKNQTNTYATNKYKYRNCEDILEAVKPLLVENATVLIINDDIYHIDNRFYVKSTAELIDTDTAEKITSTAFAREDDTKKGMDVSQITGATSSYARKYALNGLFAIDDTKDSDTTNQCSNDTNNNNQVKVTQVKDEEYYCVGCGSAIKKVIGKSGTVYEAKDLAFKSYKENGRILCSSCIKKMKEVENKNEFNCLGREANSQSRT